MTRETMLRAVADGVWVASEPVRIVGMKLRTTMTVLRLEDGALLLYSPVPLRAATRAEVDALGPVAHVYAPSTYHHLWADAWARAYPEARVHAPSALARKRPDLRIDRAHDRERDDELARSIDEVHIDGFRLDESVLVHRASGTLVVADLVHNVGRPTDPWTKLYASAMGFYDRVALSRVIRWSAFSDRRAARRSVDAVLALPFERLVVGHGEPVVRDAHDALADAYGWLEGTRAHALAGPRTLGSGACG